MQRKIPKTLHKNKKDTSNFLNVKLFIHRAAAAGPVVRRMEWYEV